MNTPNQPVQKKILITGIAGFIGYHLTKTLTEEGHLVIGIDNINDYYDVELKYARLHNLGFSKQSVQNNIPVQSTVYPNLQFVKTDIADNASLMALFAANRFDMVCHLAAQAGVRYSIINPASYIESNLVGFFNILESCRNNKIKKLVYASSSSVYGNNTKIPFSTSDITDQPVSLYAATKKSNELMAHSYSKLYNIETIGLRFFTAYGPWGRPDMAYFSFTKAICNEQPVKIFANGTLKRDFTYIDDIVAGIKKVLMQESGTISSRVYNIGNNTPVDVNSFVAILEEALGKKAVKEYLPMQPGDVNTTFADIDPLKQEYGYSPTVNLKEGLEKFTAWYTGFYQVK